MSRDWALLIAVAIALLIAALIGLALLVQWLRLRRVRRRVDWPDDAAVVLAHGLFGFDSIGVGPARQRYFRGVERALSRAGIPSYAARLPGRGSVPARAEALVAFVKDIAEPRLTIIAHSMGGLDARYAIAKLGLWERVDALVTVGTPHRGSAIADLADGKLGRRMRGVLDRIGLRIDAVDWLTTSNLEQFNRDVPDDRRVAYYSVVGDTPPWQLLIKPPLLFTSLLLRVTGRYRGHSDGIVTVASQRWGEVIEEVHADHFAQIGWSWWPSAATLYLRVLERVSRDRAAADKAA